MSTDDRARAWVDVSAEAFRANVNTVRKAVGDGVRILPMVKANAYGLGMLEAVSALDGLAPWGYGVAAVSEGRTLREAGVPGPILVCSPTPSGSYRSAVDADLTVSLSSIDGLVELTAAAREVGRPGRFHLEIDTGMGRAGIDWRDVDAWAPALEAGINDHVVWEGAYTHFHSADGADPDPTQTQWARLTSTVKRLSFRPADLLVHACNSPGALRLPAFAEAMVRPGIFLYGGVAGDGLPPPAPVASLRARIVHIKEARPGSTVGYGSTYSSEGLERWATVGIGYGDGLPRLLSNRGQAVVRGERAPIIGRISMDVTVLDVTEVSDVQVGDVVTFFGRSEGEEISLEEVAGHAQTINYEVLTGLTQRLPRIWNDHGGY